MSPRYGRITLKNNQTLQIPLFRAKAKHEDERHIINVFGHNTFFFYSKKPVTPIGNYLDVILVLMVIVHVGLSTVSFKK